MLILALFRRDGAGDSSHLQGLPGHGKMALGLLDQRALHKPRLSGQLSDESKSGEFRVEEILSITIKRVTQRNSQFSSIVGTLSSRLAAVSRSL